MSITKEEAIKAVNKAAYRITDPDSNDYNREIIHCFLGGFGADWDKEDIIKLISKSEDITWVEGQIFGHELGVRAEGKNYYFDIKK